MKIDFLTKASPKTKVFRLVTIGYDFFPEQSTKPIPASFELSSGDKEEAKLRGISALLSVWDQKMTSVPQARSFRNSNSNLTKAFSLLTKDIETKVSFPNGTNPLCVLRDPLIGQAKPGAKGHCGIHGLERKTGEEGRLYKLLRSQLVDLCLYLDD